MESTIFKKVACSFNGREYEIRVLKNESGFKVVTYQGESPAFPYGYFCDYNTSDQYHKHFGKMGWERLIHCAKADITGKKIYRVNAAPGMKKVKN